jgi:hypothetical protein
MDAQDLLAGRGFGHQQNQCIGDSGLTRSVNDRTKSLWSLLVLRAVEMI